MVTHPASSLAQDRESSPAETSVLNTMLLAVHAHGIQASVVDSFHCARSKAFHSALFTVRADRDSRLRA